MKGEGKVLQTAQRLVLSVLIFPFPSGRKRQVPVPGAWAGSRPGQRGKAEAGCCSLPCSPPASRWMGRNLPLGL